MTKENQELHIDENLVVSVQKLISEISELNITYKNKIMEIDNKINYLNSLIQKNEELINRVENFSETAEITYAKIKQQLELNAKDIAHADEKLLSLKKDINLQTIEIEGISQFAKNLSASSELVKSFVKDQDKIKDDLAFITNINKKLQSTENTLSDNYSNISNRFISLEKNINSIEKSASYKLMNKIAGNEKEFIDILAELSVSYVISKVVAEGIAATLYTDINLKRK